MLYVDPVFEWYEDSMVFHELIFTFFCLEPTVRKDTWMRTTSITVLALW